MTDYALPTLTSYLDPAEQELLASLGTRKFYADGELIHRRGDPNAALGLVISGMVKLMRETQDGRMLLMLTATAGQHYADHNALTKSRRSHHAVAVGNTTVDHYPREMFMQLLDNPKILRAFYLVTTMRLGQAIELFDDIRSLPPEVRLAKVLASIRSSAKGASRLECVQEELASLLGVSAMTLSKALKTLKTAGLIETGYRSVMILDHAEFDRWLAAKSAL